MLRTAIVSAIVSCLALPAFAQDRDPLADAIAVRQAHMQLYGHNVGILGGMARGNVDYDAEVAATAAADLAALAAISEQNYWPEGTSVEEYPDSRALPVLWEDRTAWEAGKAQLIESTMALATTAGDGPEALAGIREVFAACSTCHEAYWVED